MTNPGSGLTGDLSGLTPEKKRQLLTRLLMEKAANAASEHPLSYGQRGLWFVHKLAPDSAAYTITYAARIPGELDVAALQRAIQSLIDRHAILRTTYSERPGGGSVALVHPRWPLHIGHHQIGADQAEVDEWIRRETNRPFDLYTGPVLRVTLLGRATDHVLLLALHHIAVDFWSVDILLDELRGLYAAERGGQASVLPSQRYSERYVDYAERQIRMLDGPDGENLWRYWSDRLAGCPTTLDLPTDRSRPAVQTYNGALYRFGLGPTVTEKLKQMARAAGATPFMVMLTAYAALLYRYTGQDDLVIGSPFACRDTAAMTGLVGYVANPLPVRVDAAGDPPFRALLDRVKSTVLEAIAHQDYPLSLLVERLRPPRDASRTPLFQMSFAWDQARQFTGAVKAGQLPLETLHIGQGGAPFDITLQIGEHDGELQAGFQYNTDLFDEATIERMAQHFAALADGVASAPDTPISRLELLTEAEQSLIAQWNQTQTDYSNAPPCLHEMVAATAARVPQAVAVSFTAGSQTRELTYAELDRRANHLAHRLQRMGLNAGSDVVVPVLLERSEHLVVGLLGALKAGAAFLPLDPAQPAHRLQAILHDVADAPVCVTRTEHLAAVPDEFTGTRLCLDRPAPGDEQLPETAPKSSPGLEDLAYLIYTSGSTGTPKGALNTHAGIRNRLLWMQDTYPITESDRVLHKTPINFDPFVWEIFWPLIVGARVVIAKPEGHKDAGYLARTISDENVTAMHFVPSMLRRFLTSLATSGGGDCTGLRQVFCSGEALTADLRDEFHNRLGAELYNLYGPTEAAIDVTHFHCRRSDSDPIVPIGRPIANIAIHLLDAHLQPVGIGVPGELCISGVGVARGYLNRPEATAAAFVDDPFADGSSHTRLMYRTGDRARYRSDGNIEYLGRMDDQVKINGVRIEPGEVEAVLTAHPQIGQCAVVARPAPNGERQLIAHLAVAGEAVPTTAELRRFLLDRLPAAMIPAVFHIVDTLPLTPSGKIDRRALLAWDAGVTVAAAASQHEYVAPRNRTEQVLADIWRDVLGVARVGVHDDFFGLGGASTQALEVTLRAAAIGLELRPESMFVHGTIAELAAAYGPVADGVILEQPTEPVEASPGAAWVDQPQPTVQPTPVAAKSKPQANPNTVIESLGVYLPPRSVSTDAILAGCVNEVAIPLERFTGIKNRRMAGDGEYSIDLGRKAAEDCLSRSGYAAENIDVIIACNISRADGPDYRFTFEPSTAAQLRDQLGLGSAICFDINNACGAMFTGITVADAFLKIGLVRNALVVSGEYITHLTDTAQREIAGPIDPRLACLTLGDAGAAVVLERGTNDRVGFHDIDLATVSRYAKLCIAKVSDGPQGGAIMITDSVTQTAVAVKHAVPYVASVMQRHGWRPDTADLLIMHQTSEASINDAILAINRVFGKGAATRENTICNLAERGNTATTTHFVALYDYINNGRINPGDNIVFSITGSGQTVGTALYTFDDLPDRMRRAATGQTIQRTRPAPAHREIPRVPRVRIDSLAVVDGSGFESPSAIGLAAEAAAICLQRGSVDRRTVGLLIHCGVYRDDFLSEPAVAALVAGEIGLNDDVQSADEPTTFTFDVLNGAVGFLNACHVAAGMIAAGKAQNALISASEIENNTTGSGYPRNGLAETGSAILITPSDGSTGFGRFVFAHRPEYADALVTYTERSGQHTWLHIDRDPDLPAIYVDCIPDAVKDLLAREGLQPGDIAAVFGPQLPAAAVDDLAARIDIPRSRFIDLGVETDPFTSSLPYNVQYAQRHKKIQPGDIALIIAAGSGVEVGCTTYRF